MDEEQILDLMMENLRYHAKISPGYKMLVNDAYGFDLYEVNRKFLHSKDIHTMVAKDSNDKICGFLCYRKINNDVIAISDFYVSSSARGKGYGKKLVDDLVKKFPNRAIKLRCLKDNELGLNFYKKYGFIITKTDTDKIGIISYEMVYDTLVKI